MAREWQQTRLLEYVMPHAVYYQTIWAVRDLERMEDRLKELNREQHRQKTNVSTINEPVRRYNAKKKDSYVESQAMETLVLKERVDGIHSAMNEVPPKYRGTILNNIVQREEISIYEDKDWKMWKQRFLYSVAKNLSII